MSDGVVILTGGATFVLTVFMIWKTYTEIKKNNAELRRLKREEGEAVAQSRIAQLSRDKD